MSKKVISFRLSEDEVADLDLVCKRLNKSRSEIVATGIAVLLSEYVHAEGKLLRRTPWLLDPLTGKGEFE